MADDQTVMWPGASGTKYKYWITGLDAGFKDEDGNYIFCKSVGGYWVPVYIGQGNLNDRIGPNHHKWACIKRKGATHVHTHTNPREADRLSEERDLLAGNSEAYSPEGCNEKEGG